MWGKGDETDAVGPYEGIEGKVTRVGELAEHRGILFRERDFRGCGSFECSLEVLKGLE